MRDVILRSAVGEWSLKVVGRGELYVGIALDCLYWMTSAPRVSTMPYVDIRTSSLGDPTRPIACTITG